MDNRHHSSNTYTNVGNTNRRYRNLNYSPTANANQPSTTYSINFSVPASPTIVSRPYLPGLKRNKASRKGSYNTNLNKYKLLEKELDKRKREEQRLRLDQKQQSTAHHSQSYSNIFSNQSPQFKNRDTNCQLAKPNLARSNATINNPCETTNSLNDLYKVENLFGDVLDHNRNVRKPNDENKSKSIEFIRSPVVECKAKRELIDSVDKKLDKIEKNKLSDKLSADQRTPVVEVTDLSCTISTYQVPADQPVKTDQVDCKSKFDDDDDQTSINLIHSESPAVSPIVNQKSKPKLVPAEPSIHQTDSTIEQQKCLNQTKLNAYSVDRKQAESTKKEAIKSTCWFSWFKVFLDCSEQNSLKDMILILLKKWYRELFLVTILLICIFNAIRTSNLITRKTRLPDDFFPPNSLIHDYKFGQIQELSQLAFQNEVTFVMYYAPWNADCIAFRNEYLKISKHYKSQISFAAVNCWWPDGECSKSYRIKKFPIFIAHLRNIGEVEYKGPLVANYLIPFLDNLLNPVRPIQNEGDLLDLKSKHDVSTTFVLP